MSSIEEYQQAIERRMSNGKPFTYGELCRLGPRPVGEGGRTADKIIQKWRRKGWIVFTREGRNTVWRLTEASPFTPSQTERE